MKTTIKHLLTVTALLLVSNPCWSADGEIFYANTVEDVRLQFRIINEIEKTCEVGQYNGVPAPGSGSVYNGPITIPSSVNGYSVISIGDYAFESAYNYNLTSIDIPSSVTNIGSYAFSGCTNLTSITIPSSVTSIGNSAFQDCTNLTSITIPSSVMSIGNRAFSDCTGLTSVSIQSDVTNIAVAAFYGCTNLPIENGIRYAGTCAVEAMDKTQMYYTVRDGTTHILETFSDCTELISITLPSSLKVIGEAAFRRCLSLTSISIPSSVTYIGRDAFFYCVGLSYAEFGSIEQLCRISIESNPLNYAHHLYISGKEVKNLVIPEDVTSIGQLAFSGCTGLTSINIPSSVTSIGDCAFEGCTGLTSINIPESVTNIKRSTFSDCTGLTSINIPESVTSIGESAFHNCSSLTSINIPESVTSIGQLAFSGCTGLTSINIPSSVTSIGLRTFSGCFSLTSITIPPSVTSIEVTAFEKCSSLTSAIICGNISQSRLFSGTNLKEVTLGDNMSVIYNGLFSGCSNLERVTMGKNIQYIRTDAFKGCTKINTIQCDATEPPYCYPNVFGDIDVANCKLIVPESAVAAYAANDQWSGFDIQGFSYPTSIDLTDGETFEGYNKHLDMDEITYSRTYKNTNWQAWYVPFDLELTSDLLSRFSFAKYAGTYVDENSDPSFFITIARLKVGDKLKANTPYFVQAKTASNTAQVISVANTTLKAAKETGFDMYSAEQKVSIRGVYSAKTATIGDCDWYAYGGGSYFKATAGDVLNPFRVYLTITERDDNPYGTSPTPNQIKVKLLGDDGETIIEEIQGVQEPQDDVYDLSGRKIVKDKLEKGIYIINGKKVLVR